MLQLQNGTNLSICFTRQIETPPNTSSWHLSLTCRATGRAERATLTAGTLTTRSLKFTISINSSGANNVNLVMPEEVGGYYDYILIHKDSANRETHMDSGLAFVSRTGTTDDTTFEAYSSTTNYKAYE